MMKNRSVSAELITTIRAYDERHGTDLWKTLMAVVGIGMWLYFRTKSWV